MSIQIIGTGAYIPEEVQKNTSFLQNDFYDSDGVKIQNTNAEIIEKFTAITGIEERRYAPKNKTSSDIASIAAEKAIADANVDPETIDYIIVAHNAGNITAHSNQVDTLPCVAARVKATLKIKNPACVAYDLIFGCPGWVEGMIQAKAFIASGMAKRCLVIGSETLSRLIDATDRDSMIYADGAGATVVEAASKDSGILSHVSATYTADGEADFIFYGTAYKENGVNTKYIKMHGRKVYEFALTHVPQAMKSCLEQANIPIEQLKKIFLHQANLKMDEAIIKRFYRLYNEKAPEDVLPMNIQKFGNSSVATVPTLFNLVVKNNFEGHEISPGDIIMFASVGAGMHINAITYQV